jgi:hypothetical protein
MKETLNHQPQTEASNPAQWEQTLRRFEKMTEERPLFNGLLTFFLLLPLMNLLVRLIAGLPIDTWHYAEAFLFLLPIGAVWAGFFISRGLRRDFEALIRQNKALLEKLAEKDKSENKQ